MNSNDKTKETKLCDYCHKKMKPINTGKSHYHSDWSSRKYHKCCYNKKREDDQLKKFFLSIECINMPL